MLDIIEQHQMIVSTNKNDIDRISNNIGIRFSKLKNTKNRSELEEQNKSLKTKTRSGFTFKIFYKILNLKIMFIIYDYFYFS